jgi:hypothetical protein
VGELQNWSVLVDDLRHELVHWVRDYLAELTACSIYWAQGRWLLNLEWRAGGQREEKSTGARDAWLSPGQAYW